MALSILSGIRTDILVEAVKTGNPAMLTGIPGIGKSKAEKLVFELKRKLKKLEAYADPSPQKPSVRNEAVEALMSLGFDEAKSSKAVDEIINKFPEIPLETAVKNALKNLAG
jgi:Holliday junction DNA helicase RuvA